MPDRLTDVWPAFLPMPDVIAHDRRARRAHLLVIGSLAYCLTPKTSGRLHVRRIAERADLHRETARRCLVDLEAWGYISRKHHPGLVDFYRLLRLSATQEQLEGTEALEVAVLTQAPVHTPSPSNGHRLPIDSQGGGAYTVTPEISFHKDRADEEKTEGPSEPLSNWGRDLLERQPWSENGKATPPAVADPNADLTEPRGDET